MRDWERGRRDIVVATPGRLRDVLDTPEVARAFSHTKVLVLDEADSLLDMGFRDEIEGIMDFLPATPQRQTFLFSATVSRAIQQIARQTLDKNHVFINCVSDNAPPVHAHVNQYHTVLPSAADQIPHTLRLLTHDQLSNPGKSKVIVFFPTTKMTQLFADLIRDLSKSSLPAKYKTKVYEIHSKKSQESRNSASDAFREDKSGSSILITSDVSARGVDYPGVTRVIQVGVPAGTEQYIHRVGRTGRAGTQGRGDLVLMPWELGFVNSQLSEVPLKPLSVKELTAQTKELAAKYDEDPKAFWKDVPVVQQQSSSSSSFSRNVRSRGPIQPQPFVAPLAPVVEDIERNVTEIVSSLSEEAVVDVLFSMMGYYPSLSQEIGISKMAVLEGCKNWTTGACGLAAPPRLPESLLKRLGLVEKQRPRSSSSRSGSWSSFRDQRRPPSQNGWLGRDSKRDGHEGRDSGRSSRFSDRAPRSGRGGGDGFSSRPRLDSWLSKPDSSWGGR